MPAESDGSDIFVHFNDRRNNWDPQIVSYFNSRFVIVSYENEGKKRLWKAVPLKKSFDNICLNNSKMVKSTLKQLIINQLLQKQSNK